jgi:hypothetical protein
MHTRIIGRPLPDPNRLDRLISFCYDRFDVACGSLDLYHQGSDEYRATQRSANKWYKRATALARLREWMQ